MMGSYRQQVSSWGASAVVSRGDILLTGIAGLVADAMSMAAGEYVSVSSQSDTEHADLARETHELADKPVLGKSSLRSMSREASRPVSPARFRSN